jgi:MFS family permease
VSAQQPLTRAIFVLGVVLTAGTGATLWLFPDRTEDYWAWTIGAAPSAAFFGAGYLGAAVALALAAREQAWQPVRLVVVLALALTSLALLVTLLHPDPFAFEDGRTQPVAWIWIVVYAALPPLLLLTLHRQERAGGAQEYGGARVAGATRAGACVAGVALGALGLAYLLGWDTSQSWWPWPLTPLTAAVLGAWLLTFAVGFLWFALRDPSWPRSRIALAALGVTAALDLGAALRLWDDLDGAAAVYVGVLVAMLAGIVVVARVESRRNDPSLVAPM